MRPELGVAQQQPVHRRAKLLVGAPVRAAAGAAHVGQRQREGVGDAVGGGEAGGELGLRLRLGNQAEAALDVGLRAVRDRKVGPALQLDLLGEPERVEAARAQAAVPKEPRACSASFPSRSRR